MKKIVFVFAAVLPWVNYFAQQTNYPQHYFISPIDIPLNLSGNFGELRPNHFHTGLDLTTHNVEGLPVHAAADGYVSRIKVGPWGYGHVIYVTHPNGYTTVYGHLSRFNSAIADYVKKNQYAQESFDVELFPDSTLLQVKQGDVIAYSGNTGSSGGPHLHFEIRNTLTQDAINPMLFGLHVADSVAPVAVALAVYPIGSNAFVNGKNEVKRIALKKSGAGYVFADAKDSVVVWGDIGFAIEAYDKESVPTGKNGVYAIRFGVDGKTIYAHHFEKIPFDKTRYINCFIDYREMEAHNKFYQRSYLLPNDSLPVYDSLINNGVFNFTGGAKIHHCNYVLSDAKGNSCAVNFTVTTAAAKPHTASTGKNFIPFVRVLVWDTTNTIDDNAFYFETPKGAVYENLVFTSSVDTAHAHFSPRVTIMNRFTPLQKNCTLKIYAQVPDSLRSKALIVLVNEKGGWSSEGGDWDKNGVTTQLNDFGTFMVVVDTTAPVVKPLNFVSNGTTPVNFSQKGDLAFTISDNLSGIGSYRATVDGKWILMEYEPKKKMIFYTFDSHVSKGQHDFKLEVKDKKGNVTVYNMQFVR